MPVARSELPYFQKTRIHGYDDRLLTHSPDKLKPYTMLEIFSDVRDAMQELKDLQIAHGDGDTLLGIGKALGATLESVAQGASSIIKAIGAAIHDTLNGVGDLHEKVVGSLGEAASKVIESTGHAVKDSTTGIGNMFHGILSGIGTMVPTMAIQWRLILAIILVLLYINLFTLFKLCRNKLSRELTRRRHLSQRRQQNQTLYQRSRSIPYLPLNNPLTYLSSWPVSRYTMFLPHMKNLVSLYQQQSHPSIITHHAQP